MAKNNYDVALSEEINKISLRYPEVSFAKLSRIAVHFAKWQERRMADAIKTAEDHAFLAGAEWEKEKDKDSIIDAYVCESFNAASEQGCPNLHGVTIIYEDNANTYLLAGEHVKLKILK